MALLVAFVAAFAGTAAQAATRGQTITVLLVKVAEKQPTKLTLLETDQAYVAGKNVGHDILNCTVTSKTTIACVALITLGADTVNAHFTATAAASSGIGTLDSGTGSFQNKKGTFTWKNLDAQGKRTRLVLKFS